MGYIFFLLYAPVLYFMLLGCWNFGQYLYNDLSSENKWVGGFLALIFKVLVPMILLNGFYKLVGLDVLIIVVIAMLVIHKFLDSNNNE